MQVGPWKFSGLPGLVLYIEDESKNYSWQLVKMEIPYKKNDVDLQSIFANRKKYKEVSFKDYDKIYTNAIQDKVDIFRSRHSGNGLRVAFSYSTDYEKEPKNEFRTKTLFQ